HQGLARRAACDHRDRDGHAGPGDAAVHDRPDRRDALRPVRRPAARARGGCVSPTIRVLARIQAACWWASRRLERLAEAIAERQGSIPHPEPGPNRAPPMTMHRTAPPVCPVCGALPTHVEMVPGPDIGPCRSV